MIEGSPRMNIHKNARLTAQGRHLLVRRVEELGWRMVEAVKAAGISQRQGYRWLARYRSGGSAELGDRSSAPQVLPASRRGGADQ
jgi:transposase